MLFPASGAVEATASGLDPEHEDDNMAQESIEQPLRDWDGGQGVSGSWATSLLYSCCGKLGWPLGWLPWELQILLGIMSLLL